MAVALPLSKWLTGLSLFFIAGAWIVGGNFKEKLALFFANKIALLWCSVFVMHLLGLLYTNDFHYASNDLRIKLILFILPFVMSSSKPLSASYFNILMHLFIAAVVTSSLVSIAVLLDFIHRPVADVRDISFLISHIRLALLVCLAIFSLLHFLKNSASTTALKITYAITLLWLIVFLFILESVTGIVVLLVVSALILVYQLFKNPNRKIKFVYASLLIALPIGLFLYLKKSYHNVTHVNAIDLNHLDSLTSNRNKYIHVLQDKSVENGNYVGLYICNTEVDSVWNTRSKINIDSLDLRHQPVRYTLFRFLTSKGLRKDAAGINALNEKEIASIEHGITNVNYQSIVSLQARLQQIFWEINTYIVTGNPTGHSVTMRYEYWKTAAAIIKDNPIIGVGTGDVNNAFLTKYEEIKSPLSQQWRLRAHNQFLTIAVSFGIVGLLWF